MADQATPLEREALDRALAEHGSLSFSVALFSSVIESVPNEIIVKDGTVRHVQFAIGCVRLAGIDPLDAAGSEMRLVCRSMLDRAGPAALCGSAANALVRSCSPENQAHIGALVGALRSIASVVRLSKGPPSAP